jgi:lactoylglutathione lyase
MQLGYTLVYVPEVEAAVSFYERAFGLARKFVHDSGHYGELDTGATTLAFASEAMAQMNGIAIRPHTPQDVAAAFELCLVTNDPDAAYARALGAGAYAVKPTEQKPWGQRVAYVRDLNGCLVELCTPIAR